MGNTLWHRLPDWAHIFAVLLAGLWGTLLVIGGVDWQNAWLVLWGGCLAVASLVVLFLTRDMSAPWQEPPATLALISGVQTAGLILLATVLIIVGLVALALAAAVFLLGIVLSIADS